MDVGNEYLRIIIERFESLRDLGEKTIHQLTEDDIHWNYNNESNSIAVIVKHLNGNMVSRWTDFLNSDGEKTFRKRDQEFEDDISSKSKVLSLWDAGWNVLFDALKSLTGQDLVKQVSIRGESHLVMEAIERQMAHYAYHIGQVVYIGKQIQGDDWQSLSIPKGKSNDYLNQMLKKHRNQ